MQKVTVTRINAMGDYAKEEFTADPSRGEFLATATDNGELTVLKRLLNPVAQREVPASHRMLHGADDYTLFATVWTRVFPHYYEMEFEDTDPGWQFLTTDQIRHDAAARRGEVTEDGDTPVSLPDVE